MSTKQSFATKSILFAILLLDIVSIIFISNFIPKGSLEMRKGFSIFCFRIIPKSILSRIFGKITRIKFPKSILNIIIRSFCNKYRVNTDEILYPEDGFKTIDHFFTRKLLPGVHPIDDKPMSVVSPVDGRIDEFGAITGTRIIQAKNIDYLLPDLVQSQIHSRFLDGSYMTIYLSPADYHRIHSPVAGKISGVTHIPGKLFPVKEFVVKGLPGLFSKNERVVTHIETPYGKCLVCMVGAMNVGRITVSHDNLITNKHMFRQRKEITYSAKMRPHVTQGDEIGTFHLGSTVILIFEKGMVDYERIKVGSKVRMGQKIATILKQSS
jgi:phosphatidylserine decarboxylase